MPRCTLRHCRRYRPRASSCSARLRPAFSRRCSRSAGAAPRCDGHTQRLLAPRQGGVVGHASVQPGQFDQALGQARCLAQAQPKHALQCQAELDRSVAEHSRATWPRPLAGACHWRSASSQTINDPLRLSTSLYSLQFVVRYFARGGLLIPRAYPSSRLELGPARALCNNVCIAHKGRSSYKGQGQRQGRKHWVSRSPVCVCVCVCVCVVVHS